MNRSNLLRFLLLLTLLIIPSLACSAVTGFFTKDISGDWVGTYTCNQGLTNLDLKITRAKQDNIADNISAVFDFSANQSNPSVPSGSYTLKGFYNPSTHTINLLEDAWINQPAGFTMVGLEGKMSEDGTKLTGAVLGPNCTTFDLTKK
jgi:hypothetical protein